MIGPRIALTALLALAVLSASAAMADGSRAITFVDGLWQGGIAPGPTGKDSECWAAMTVDGGTTLTLAKRSSGSWKLRLSNPGWRLPSPHQYDMVVRVDFYPRLSITGEAPDQTSVEIDDLERIALLDLIENGHTIDLASDSFTGTYTLEGSAKIIERIRNCAASGMGASTP